MSKVQNEDRSQITIYHNAQCSKSTSACNLLLERDASVKVVNYLDTPPDREELLHLLALLGMKPSQLIRKNEPVFIEFYVERNLTEADYFQAMLNHPILIERPIIVKEDNKAIIGRPPESVLDFLY